MRRVWIVEWQKRTDRGDREKEREEGMRSRQRGIRRVGFESLPI